MPDQMTLEQFGQTIKKKYPEYANLSDTDIANKVIAKYPQYKTSIKDDTLSEAGTAKAPDWRDKYTTFTHQSDTPVHAVEDVFGNIGASALNTVLRPGETAKGIYRMSGPGVIEDLVLGRKIAPLELVESIIKHPADTVESMIGSAAVFDAAGEAVGPVTRGLRDTAAKAREGAGRIAASTGPDVAKELVKKTQAENVKLAEDHGKDLQKHQSDVRDVRKSNVEALTQHISKLDEVAKDRNAGKAILDARDALQKSVDEATKDADIRTEDARHEALKEGNDKYNGVNGKLDPIEADPVAVRNMTVDARSIISDQRGKLPSLLKDFDDRVNGTSVTGSPNGPLNYDELQKWYSKFGNEISKGNIPGEEFHAYDKLHEAIGNEMQRIADSQGQGEALKVAREYWRRMKQTFGKSSDTINNRAAKEVNEANPDAASGQVSEYRRRLLGSFDPEIPKLLDAVDRGKQRLKELPGEKEGRGLAATKPEAPPEPKPLPSEPKLEQKKIGTKELTEANKESMAAKEKRVRTGYAPIVSTGLFIDAIRSAMEGNLEHAGIDVAARGLYEIGKQGFAALLRNPNVIETLTRPTEAQIAAIPKELRGVDLKPLIREAQNQGIKVDPTLAALFGATAVRGPKTKKLQEDADYYRLNPR